jgi:hypothetical protein
VVESSGLLNRRRGLNLYRGFESLPLRQINNLRSVGKLRFGLVVLAGERSLTCSHSSYSAGTTLPELELPKLC